MNDYPPKVTKVHLRPGEVWFGGADACVHTLLGSCVSITLWHPRRRFGGMCHYLLADSAGAERPRQPGYYGDDALAFLLRKLRFHGLRPAEMEAKVFGGGAMFGDYPAGEGCFNVSHKNVTWAVETLRRHGFDVKAEDTGGRNYRVLHFEVWSGDVWVRHGRPGPDRNHFPGKSQ